MRIGLLVERFALPVPCRFARLYTEEFRRLLTEFAPARTVPALRLPSGAVIAESLAIAEELAARFPSAGLWPGEPDVRAVARSLAAEMHAGFAALREDCPMNLRAAYRGVPVSEAVAADLARIERLWEGGRTAAGRPGPWLCGAYSVADAFFAPVAMRIAGYSLPVSTGARAYVDLHLADPAFRQWRAAGLAEGPDQDFYRHDFEQVSWPEPQTVNPS